MADKSFEQQLASAIALLAGGIGGKALGGGGNNIPPQIGQLLDMEMQRQAYSNPLRQAVTQGAYGMLPTFMREGTQLTGGLTNTIPPPGNYGGSGGSGISGKGLAGSGALAALAALLGKNGGGAEGDLTKLFKWIKSKFGGGGRSVQGNKPQRGGIGPDMNPYGDFTGWYEDSGPQDFMGPQDTYLDSDPGVYYGESGAGAYPTDPSGGTGVGPGMKGFYDDYGYEDGY